MRPAAWLLGVALLSACSPTSTTATSSGGGQDSKYVYFTYSMLRIYGLSVEDALKLQFYTSEQILLNRTVSAGSSAVTQGKLVTRAGVTIDEVEVVPMTPGVARSISEDAIVVGFGGKSTFEFAPTSVGNYALSIEDWDAGACAGHTTYGDLAFDVLAPSCRAKLVIDKNALTEVKKNKETLPGEKVGN